MVRPEYLKINERHTTEGESDVSKGTFGRVSVAYLTAVGDFVFAFISH